MCYSAEVSFLTWGFGMACAAFLVSTGKSLQSIAFPLTIVQMQLIEGLRWIDAVDERILALLGKIAIGLQPAAAFYEAKQYWLILPYVAVQAVVELLYGSRDLRFVVADDGHFEWKWMVPEKIATAPYWIALFLGGSFILPWYVSAAMLGLLTYFFVNHAEYGTYGSLWCVWVNLLWIYYLVR